MKKGFTLVELMIVIAIIGILSTVLYPSITGYFARARDTKKKSELNQINNAITLYYIDNGTYKIPGTGWKDGGQGWVNFKHTDASIGYRKSILKGLQEGGYINNSIKIFERERAGIRTKINNNQPCETNVWGIDLYMLYSDDTTGRYSLSATLEYPKIEDIEKIQTLHNGMGEEGTCEKYGKNYGIGN